MRLSILTVIIWISIAGLGLSLGWFVREYHQTILDVQTESGKVYLTGPGRFEAKLKLEEL